MNIFMKKLSLLVLAALTLTGCWTARIWTVVPTTEPVAPVQTVYTTQVTTPSPKVTTVSTFTVTNYSTDPCFYLDLNAVAAAFAESRSVQEFEQLLNSSRYMINNLDLNRDGWIDYLRVIETHKGYYHTLLIQACLAPGVFQDVATLIAERRADVLMVEVIGDTYLYGYNYIVRPVFVKRPPMWDVYGRPSYNPWSSPYHYGYLPSYYTKPKPIYLNHYQAYVNTYMHNHGYCHHCDYPTQPFYTGYTTMTQPHNRHDYQTQHPNDSFEQRVTRSATPGTRGTTTVRNAGQLRQMVATTTTPTTTTRTTTTTTPRQPSTSVDTRVNRSGTTRTTVKTTDSNGRTQTVKRESPTSTRSSGTSTRTSGTSTRTSGSSTRTSGTSTRTPSSGSR